MAELGLVASIITLASVATKLSKRSLGYHGHCGRSKDHTNKVTLLSRSLRDLAKSFKKPKKLSSKAEKTARELVYSCSDLINELRQSLAKSPLGKSKGKGLYRKRCMVVQKGEGGDSKTFTGELVDDVHLYCNRARRRET
jgi:hypothetical protein